MFLRSLSDERQTTVVKSMWEGSQKVLKDVKIYSTRLNLLKEILRQMQPKSEFRATI